MKEVDIGETSSNAEVRNEVLCFLQKQGEHHVL